MIPILIAAALIEEYQSDYYRLSGKAARADM